MLQLAITNSLGYYKGADLSQKRKAVHEGYQEPNKKTEPQTGKTEQTNKQAKHFESIEQPQKQNN